MATNDEIITNFVREFDAPAPDAARLGTYFADDAVYHNIPMKPVAGRAAIEKVLGGMATTMLSAGWEVRHQAATGDVVMNERVDRFTASGKTIEIPVMGVFELKDGKIIAWRDYFDLAMFQSQMG